MKIEAKSFAIGSVVTLAVLVVLAWPYKDEIIWAYKNRKSLGKASDVLSTVKGLFT
jgi:hypothetical protein